LQHGIKAGVQFQLLFDDGHKDINGDGDPDLGFHRILRSPVKNLDAEMLLDPFEEHLDFPPAPEKLGYGQSRQGEVVGQKDQSFLFLGIEVANSPESVGIISAGIKAMELDDLIGLNSFGLVRWLGK